jgi:hypothetical protein
MDDELMSGPGLGAARKLRPDVSNGMVMVRIFSVRNNQVFSDSAQIRPDPARK